MWMVFMCVASPGICFTATVWRLLIEVKGEISPDPRPRAMTVGRPSHAGYRCRRASNGALIYSGADRVGHALLGEARLGRTVELLFRRRRVARLLRVGFAFFQEACLRG